ncbi:MAG: DNA repair protein RadC [Treponema sp.]|nr:DNA repair protein RadC [Treponema sp.]
MYKRQEKLNIRELALSNGMAYPSNVELIMMILGSGTRRMPIEILAEKALKVIEDSNPPELIHELLKLEGIGTTKALMIAAAMEIGRRLNRNPQGRMNRPADIVPFVQNYAITNQEHFLCVSLTGARDILSVHVVCVGASNMAVVRPREVFCEAIKEHASAIVLCHNHPSGHCTPSKEDLMMTAEMVDAAMLLGIAVLDHIILTKNSYFSLLEHNLLPGFELKDKMEQ